MDWEAKYKFLQQRLGVITAQYEDALANAQIQIRTIEAAYSARIDELEKQLAEYHMNASERSDHADAANPDGD